MNSLKTTKKVEKKFQVASSLLLTTFYAIATPLKIYFSMYMDFVRFCLLIGFVVINATLTLLETKKWFHEANSFYKFLIASFISLLVFASTGLGLLLGIGVLLAAAPIIFCVINGIAALINAVEAKGEALLEKKGKELAEKWENTPSDKVVEDTKKYLESSALSAGYEWIKDKLKSVWGIKRLFSFIDTFENKMNHRRTQHREKITKIWSRLKKYWDPKSYDPINEDSAHTSIEDEEITQNKRFDFKDPTNKETVKIALNLKAKDHAQNKWYKRFDTTISLLLIPANIFLFQILPVAQIGLTAVACGISGLLAISFAKTSHSIITAKNKTYIELAQEETNIAETSIHDISQSNSPLTIQTLPAQSDIKIQEGISDTEETSIDDTYQFNSPLTIQTKTTSYEIMNEVMTDTTLKDGFSTPVSNRSSENGFTSTESSPFSSQNDLPDSTLLDKQGIFDPLTYSNESVNDSKEKLNESLSNKTSGQLIHSN